MSINFIKNIPQYLIPQHALSVFAGRIANSKHTAFKNYVIQRFIKNYGVNMQEALVEDPTAYACFNDFFIRKLKPNCRPIANSAVISPVDGCISEIGSIEQGQILQAKGKYYTVQELLACNKDEADQFTNGRFATLYLSPKDYHRVHMPIEATLRAMTYVPGALFSVQPSTVNAVPKLFARNERLVVYFDTPLGAMALVMVGAVIVGAIGTSWGGDVVKSKSSISFEYPDKTLQKGEEMGYFKLGSTVVLLFANGEKIKWEANLKAGSAIQLGQPLADFKF